MRVIIHTTAPSQSIEGAVVPDEEYLCRQLIG
jgi:hypothetical protein